MRSGQRKRRSPVGTEKYEHNDHTKRHFGQQNPGLLPHIWKLNGNIFFELFISDLDEKLTSIGGLQTTQKRKQRKKLIWQALIIQYSQAFHTRNENTA